MGFVKMWSVLVVDDEKDICAMFSKWLSQENISLKCVTSGDVAIELLEQMYFDVVFLDIIMPGVSVFEVIEKIKKKSPKTQIITISGKLIDNKLREAVKQRGAEEIIQKPFKMDDIIKYF